MASPRSVIIGCLSALAFFEAHAQSAWEQAKELAGPNYRPPAVPMPQMKCETCGARAAPAATAPAQRNVVPTRPAAPSLDPGVAVGAAIFGSFLQGIFTPFEMSPALDPAALARQEAARRQAEEDARRRMVEEEARHAALLRSLKAAPQDGRSGVAQPAGDTPALKALAELDAQRQGEAMRWAASQGWEGAEDEFAARYRILAASPAVVSLAAVPLCANRACRWPEPTKPIGPVITIAENKAVRLGQDAVGAWKRAGDDSPRSMRAVLEWQMMREIPTEAAKGRWQLIREHQTQLRDSLKELAMAWVIIAVDTYGGTIGKGLLLMKDTYELAKQDFEDAAKAAQWLASPHTTVAMPEVTSIEEAAQPFLYRGITEQEKLAEEARVAFGVVTDATTLAKKLVETWRQ